LEKDFPKEPVLDPASAITAIGWLSLHFASLAAAWGTRIATGSRLELPLQLACFIAITAVGTTAWLNREYGNGLSILSGFVLVATVLTAVIDFRRTHEIQPILHTASHG
jgi:hypothetical protein